MKNRIKAIRKSDRIHLSQEAFGAKLGVTGAAISRIESGERNLTDQLIISICQIFHVNEAWLRTGEGSMFTERSRDDEIATFVNSIIHDLADFRYRLIGVLSRLSPDEWALLEQKINELAAPDPIETKVDAYRAELQAEDQPPTLSASPIGEENIG